MGAQMSQEGLRLSRIPPHMSSPRMEREGILLLCAWLTAHSPYWAQARKRLEGQTFAGTPVLVASGQGCALISSMLPSIEGSQRTLLVATQPRNGELGIQQSLALRITFQPLSLNMPFLLFLSWLKMDTQSLRLVK